MTTLGKAVGLPGLSPYKFLRSTWHPLHLLTRGRKYALKCVETFQSWKDLYKRQEEGGRGRKGIFVSGKQQFLSPWDGVQTLLLAAFYYQQP